MRMHSILSPEYGRSLGKAALVVIVLLVFSVMTRDRLTLQITYTAVAGFLGGVVSMILRRPQTPTTGDTLLLQYGFVPLWLAAQYGIRYAWSWMGRM